MAKYLEFENICLVDTLTPTDKGEKQLDLFAISEENTERIKRQNDRSISLIIGNPPYNAKQENFNDNNANRSYPAIDLRIKESYIKEGTAQNQIVVYDMYTRFIRWATDRLNDEGIIAFISNSSFVDARAFDGVRKCLETEFDYIYILDLGGNVRAISGKDGIFISEKHTIFGVSAMTGIAIYFLIKDKSKLENSDRSNNKAKIYYCHPFHIHELRENKLSYISSQLFKAIPFEQIKPDKKHNWINLTDNDFDDLIALIDKDVKAGKKKVTKDESTGKIDAESEEVNEEAIFKLFSRGVATQRDEWVYDLDKENLEVKVKFLINTYQATLKDNNYPDKDKIKWDRELTKYLERKIDKTFVIQQIVKSSYRPFCDKYFYFDKHFNGMTYQWCDIYNQGKNLVISTSALGGTKLFHCLVSSNIIDLHLTGDSQCLPLYRYENGERVENITDWALTQFREYYTSVQPLSPSPVGANLVGFLKRVE